MMNPIQGGIGIVATGCVRSGTMFMAYLLQRIIRKANGGQCGHETLFSNSRCIAERGGMPNLWLDRTIGESSYLVAPFLEVVPNEVPLIHLIRDPLQWLRSFSLYHMTVDGYPLLPGAVEIKPSVHLMYKYVPTIIGIENHLERGLAWWCAWNQMIDDSPHTGLRVRLTAADVCYGKLQPLLANAEIDIGAREFNAVQTAIGTEVNHAPRDEGLTWERIPDGHAKEGARALWSTYTKDENSSN